MAQTEKYTNPDKKVEINPFEPTPQQEWYQGIRENQAEVQRELKTAFGELATSLSGRQADLVELMRVIEQKVDFGAQVSSLEEYNTEVEKAVSFINDLRNSLGVFFEQEEVGAADVLAAVNGVFAQHGKKEIVVPTITQGDTTTVQQENSEGVKSTTSVEGKQDVPKEQQEVSSEEIAQAQNAAFLVDSFDTVKKWYYAVSRVFHPDSGSQKDGDTFRRYEEVYDAVKGLPVDEEVKITAIPRFSARLMYRE